MNCEVIPPPHYYRPLSLYFQPLLHSQGLENFRAREIITSSLFYHTVHLKRSCATQKAVVVCKYKKKHVGQNMPSATAETTPATPGSTFPNPGKVGRPYYHEAERESSRVAASSGRVRRRDRIPQQWNPLKQKSTPSGSPGPQPRGPPRTPSEIFRIQHLKTYSNPYIKRTFLMKRSSRTR